MTRFMRMALTAFVVGVLAPVATVTAYAAEVVMFKQDAFMAAQAANKSIIVEVTAPWCPVCAKQKPIIESLVKDPKFNNVVLMKVDFDSQKDALAKFNVSKQSTLIAFKGATEKTRSTGETDAAKLRGIFDAAL